MLGRHQELVWLSGERHGQLTVERVERYMVSLVLISLALVVPVGGWL